MISDGLRRGLLLPQVPVEHGWDRETFLQQTCRKAGLPIDAWQRFASIDAFTAEVFGDESGMVN
jgi:AMMECR1 domain-containing protein